MVHKEWKYFLFLPYVLLFWITNIHFLIYLKFILTVCNVGLKHSEFGGFPLINSFYSRNTVNTSTSVRTYSRMYSQGQFPMLFCISRIIWFVLPRGIHFQYLNFDGFSENDIICLTKQQCHSRRMHITLYTVQWEKYN